MKPFKHGEHQNIPPYNVIVDRMFEAAKTVYLDLPMPPQFVGDADLELVCRALVVCGVTSNTHKIIMPMGYMVNALKKATGRKVHPDTLRPWINSLWQYHGLLVREQKGSPGISPVYTLSGKWLTYATCRPLDSMLANIWSPVAVDIVPKLVSRRLMPLEETEDTVQE